MAGQGRRIRTVDAHKEKKNGALESKRGCKVDRERKAPKSRLVDPHTIIASISPTTYVAR